MLNEDSLVYSEDYAQTMEETVLPYLEEHAQKHTVSGFEERPLAAVLYKTEKARGTVFVVHGFTENAFKFSELIFSLMHQGYDVVSYDQRGHGFSWRKIPEELSLTHVDAFQEYVLDLKAVYDHFSAEVSRPVYLFAHSMGGAVAVRFLQEYPELFAKAALCAPMIAANRNRIPFFLSKGICRAAILKGDGEKRIFLSKPYTEKEKFEDSCASGLARFNWYEQTRFSTPEYHNNGPTYRWTLESLQISQKILWTSNLKKIQIPVRLYTAENDNSVLPSAQKMLVRALPEAERIFVHGARHEIYRSEDEVLFPWWKNVLDFLQEE